MKLLAYMIEEEVGTWKITGENFCQLVEKKIFDKNTFADCSLVLQKDAMAPNFTEKNFCE